MKSVWIYGFVLGMFFFCQKPYCDDALKNLSNALKAEDATGAAELVIDDPKFYVSQDVLRKRVAKRDLEALRTDQVGVELLKDLRLTRFYEGHEGIPMPPPHQPEIVLDDAAAKRKGEGYDRSDISPCRKSRIIKRPGSGSSRTVWLDMLFNYEDTFNTGLEPTKLYGEYVKIRRLARDAPRYQIEQYRGEGATCVPFRIRVVGDTEYHLFGDAALRKY